MHGWLNIHKPLTLTSARVVSKVKYFLKNHLNQSVKVGHAGTLDPCASGVLPIAIGHATKLIPFLMQAAKRYSFTIQFGTSTTTGDQEGEITGQTDVFPSAQEVHAVCSRFIGKIMQTPPNFSAIKVNGVRAYKLARITQNFVLQPRQIEIFALNCQGYDPISKTAIYTVHCSKGTYIRSLAIDLAGALQTLGFVIKLVRTAVGSFAIDESITLEQDLSSSIRPLTEVLSNILEVPVDEYVAQKVKYGQKVRIDLPDGLVRLSYEEQLLSIGEIKRGVFVPQRVFI